MNVLILGATGMLGHKLVQVLPAHLSVTAAIRGSAAAFEGHPVLGDVELLGEIHAENFDSVVQALSRARPEVVINCVGIVKQRPEAEDPVTSIAVNSLFPHRLAILCEAVGSRLIHLSTDCVFSGNRGNYAEGDPADPVDLYGRSKLLGELHCEHCLTLRTSTIGRELRTNHSLLEWFLSQEGKSVSGYKRAVFSGFTTLALAGIISWIVRELPALSGVWHVASEPIDKFELLSLVKRVYGLDIGIEMDDKVVCDRSLNSDRFRQETGFVTPSWPEMIHSMYLDPTPYAAIRRASAY